MADKIVKIVLILIVILAVIAGVLFAFDKIFQTNSLQDIRNSIEQLLNLNKEEEGKEKIDTRPLSAELKVQNLLTFESAVTITLKTNKEVYIDDSSRLNLTFLKNGEDSEDESVYWYGLEIKNLGIGDTTININVKDKADNSEKVTIGITRQGYTLPFGMKSIEPWPDFKYTADGDNLKAQVNKSNRLTNDYVPQDLKNLNTDYLLYTNTATILLNKEAADYLNLMLSDLKAATGKNVVIASGYRSYNEQYTLYANWVKQLGQEEADRISARPGFSEHQLGTVVDFIDEETGLELTNNFDSSIAGSWLKANSQKYGFVQSYPEGKESTTGYSHEAWHYRYIGIENAKAVQESSLTLKEWLEQNP